jgi:hypothetical protein
MDLLTCQYSTSSAYAAVMAKPTKVVPIRATKPGVVALDEKVHRVILTIGRQRIAFDFSTRITELPPETDDREASVLPFRKKQDG